MRIRSHTRRLVDRRPEPEKGWGDLTDEAIEAAKEETLASARRRCGRGAPWAANDCVRFQERVLDELELYINNDEELYNNGPNSDHYDEIVDNVIEWIKDSVETTFKPEAEEEIDEMYQVEIEETDPEKRNEQKVKGIVNMLTVPFLEQFTEIPKEDRRRAVNDTMTSIRYSLDDFKTALKEHWPERSRRLGWKG